MPRNALASRLESTRSSPTVMRVPALSTATWCAGWRSTCSMSWTTVAATACPGIAGSGRELGHGGEREPPVDHDRLPVDRCTARGAQERHDLGDLVGRG